MTFRGTFNAPHHAPAGQGQVRFSLPTECKRCEYCWTRQFGCTRDCYCHRHPLEPKETP